MSGGNVHKLRLPPLVRVERWSAGWIVSVRPCPDNVASMRNFLTEVQAAEYAEELQREHGFRVRPDRYAIGKAGAAA
jgi:hypothetical protein